jgi:hypothetical protein
VFCVFKAGVTKAPPRIIEYRSYKRYNKESFLQDLRNNNWSAAVDDNDINATVDNWCKCFTDIADLHAPISIKKMKVKGVNIPWMTAELSQAMQQRDHHLKKAQKTQSKTHWSAYGKYRCFVNKKVRECKSSYYENLMKENKNNPSGLWKTLNELTSRNLKSSAPISILTDGVEHKNTKSMSWQYIFYQYWNNFGKCDQTKMYAIPVSRKSTTWS